MRHAKHIAGAIYSRTSTAYRHGIRILSYVIGKNLQTFRSGNVISTLSRNPLAGTQCDCRGKMLSESLVFFIDIHNDSMGARVVAGQPQQQVPGSVPRPIVREKYFCVPIRLGKCATHGFLNEPCLIEKENRKSNARQRRIPRPRIRSEEHVSLLKRTAGLPAITESGGKDLVTTAPAPITHLSPISTPFKTITPSPIKHSSPMNTGDVFTDARSSRAEAYNP